MSKQLTNSISGKAPINVPFGTQLLCLGEEKPAFLFASLVPSGTPTFILTEDEPQSKYVQNKWDNGKNNYITEQSKYAEAARNFIRDGSRANLKTTIVVTTTPEGGKSLLDQLFSDPTFARVIECNPDELQFVLPQYPNPFLADFQKTGCPVIQLDDYPIAGKVEHRKDKVAQTDSVIRENTSYVITSAKPLKKEQQDRAKMAVTHLCGSQEIRETKDVSQLKEVTPSSSTKASDVSQLEMKQEAVSRL